MSEERTASDIELNYKRALLFLQLAIEQLHTVDHKASHELRSFYRDRISFIFANHIKADEYQILAGNSAVRDHKLLPLSHDFFDDAVKHLVTESPGLCNDRTIPFVAKTRSGSSGRRPALPSQHAGLTSAGTSLSSGTLSSDLETIWQGQPRSCIDAVDTIDYNTGSSRRKLAIGGKEPDSAAGLLNSAPSVVEDKINIRLDQLESSKVSSCFVSDGWDWGNLPESTQLQALTNKTSPRKLWHDGVLASSGVITDSPSFSYELAQVRECDFLNRSPRSFIGYEKFSQIGQTSHGPDVADTFPTISSSDQEANSGHQTETWARIAALTNSALPVTNPDSKLRLTQVPRASLALSISDQPHSALKFTPVPRLSYGFGRDGKEAFEGQLRVVWLLNLPASYSALQVSRNITSGPLFSLSLEKDVAEHLPGLSACIIFQFSTHAKEFLLANECSVTFRESADDEQLPTPETSQNEGLHNQYHKDAPNAVLQLGNPYPISSHPNIFAKMLPPYMARRRVKWARARLFHSVPITTFKRDVLRLIGKQDLIELWHFYNPGECTVVFASVAVAIKVVDAFKHWATGKSKASPRRTDDEVEKVKADGRYVGIEVAFCKDFNETPAGKLVSSYGLGNSASTAVSGYEGLFEGPKIKNNAP